MSGAGAADAARKVLYAIRARLQATLQGVETVRPALAKFYASLTQKQQQSFVAVSEPTAKS